ncbi:hypothetical protein CDAR_522131 [Caerostris darwini]|uniref:Uncharacterized protein n=1 Tax=Caerostris darwini TaxID=1538125 RepID=A0AAV4STF8_9ARAC|nr:hypothetical protein CDAR_522131 [Caerostris darwini]
MFSIFLFRRRNLSSFAKGLLVLVRVSYVRVNEGSEIHGCHAEGIDGWGKGIIVTGGKVQMLSEFRFISFFLFRRRNLSSFAKGLLVLVRMSYVRVNEGSEIHGRHAEGIDGWGKGIIVTGEKVQLLRCFLL